MFQKATKTAARLRLALAGPSGSGKTYTALTLAARLVQTRGGRVALLDTEHGSAAKYGDIFDFDTAALDGDFHPYKFIEAIHFAESAGYQILVIDSLSHAWSGPGGVLELVERYAKVTRNGNRDKYAAWGEVTPIHNALIEAILASQMDIIATMRSKTEYARDEKGNIQKLGMNPIQRDGTEYEFDVVGDMNIQNELVITKSRCPDLAGKAIPRPGPAVADTLLAWLAGPSARVDWADQFFTDALALGYPDTAAVKAILKEAGYTGLDRRKTAEMMEALTRLQNHHEPAPA